MTTKTVPSDQIDDPEIFKALARKPDIAWPTILVLIAAFVIFGVSTYAYLTGGLSLFWAIALNTIASYMSFTPAHDASHSAVSTNRQLNDWVGRISTILQSPVPIFRTFRYIHMQHHKFTNDPAKDPDMHVACGPRWLLPFKWMTLDLGYLNFYLRRSVFMKRPKSERRELVLAFLFGAAVFTAIALAGWLKYYLLLFFIPTRFTAIILALSFDFLPHYPHKAQVREQPFQSTSNRVGFEWLLTPLLLYQNYHLVHHIYPTVPFYRLLKIWKAKKHFHASQNPATVDAFALTPRGPS